MAKSKRGAGTISGKPEESPKGKQAAKVAEQAAISAYEDDPEPGILVTLPVPDVAKTPLAYSFPSHAPKPAPYQPGTVGFRYWNAAVALRRGADFWGTRVPSGEWQMGNTLEVLLDEGEDLNAYYDRRALNFFHGPGPTGTVYSGESPDVLLHEMGHAILDSVKPQLWDVASLEPPAFHESFGDMSAILSALQLPSLRVAVLSETAGHLYRNSRLSRLAEQLGTAIRAQAPDAVDPDCLRNAVNSFIYQDPVPLPSSGPASRLTSEPHSFSRVFTGAFFEALAGFLSATAADPAAPTEEELLAVTSDMADILIEGVRQAPVVPNFYAQVAAAMVQASTARNQAYSDVLKAVFADRHILSLESVTAIGTLQTAAAAVAPVAIAGVRPLDAPLARLAIPIAHPSLGNRALIVHAASQVRRYAATAAANHFGSIEPPSSETSARAFTEDLLRRRKVDLGKHANTTARLQRGRGLKTHRITETDGTLTLERVLFDCGHAHR